MERLEGWGGDGDERKEREMGDDEGDVIDRMVEVEGEGEGEVGEEDGDEIESGE